MDLQGILYEEPSVWLFLLVTCIMGGWAAWMAGKACASTWRPAYVLAGYLTILTLAVRFIHFALFRGTLLSLHFFLVDLVVIQAIGAVGYRFTRAAQMASRYRWLYTADGSFGWKRRG